MRILLLSLLILSLLIGCVKEQEPEENGGEFNVEDVERDYPETCIRFGDRCNDVSIFRFDEVDLKLNGVYYERTYELKDGDKTVCKIINETTPVVSPGTLITIIASSEIEMICEPKMIKYSFSVYEAELTYNNETVAGYFINDTKELENIIPEMPIDLQKRIRVERLCTSIELQEPDSLIGSQYCYRSEPVFRLEY